MPRSPEAQDGLPGERQPASDDLKSVSTQATEDAPTQEHLSTNPSPEAPAAVSSPADVTGLARFTLSLLSAGEPAIYRRVCAEIDRVVIETVLRHVNGNQVQASELLGISRTTLRAKLRILGLRVERGPSSSTSPRTGH
jgi:DNA-binding protein Fis